MKNVVFSYGEACVFDGLNLEIMGGKKTALVGVSGAGKTTLIKLIAGYLHPTKGSVVIDGQDLKKTKLQSGFLF